MAISVIVPDIPATTMAAFVVGDESYPVSGPFAGLLGEVDEVLFDEDPRPYRVRFDQFDGSPVAWFAASDLVSAGGSR